MKNRFIVHSYDVCSENFTQFFSHLFMSEFEQLKLVKNFNRRREMHEMNSILQNCMKN